MSESSINGVLKILFVDDEENVLKSLERLFMDEEYEILTALSGFDGLKLLSENPDMALIVSDHRMPGMTGVEFLTKAREITPDSKRVVLTGYADTEAAIDAINEGGVDRYLSKPWDDDLLKSVVADMVASYSLERENKRLNEIIKIQNKEIKRWNDELEQMVQFQTIDLTKKNERLDSLNRTLKSNFTGITHSFSLLLGLRDRSAPSHARNVSELSEAVAREIGLDTGEIEAISTAAVLHDTGKIGSPDIVLSKPPVEMTREELKEYRMHPIRGQTAVSNIEEMKEVGVLIRHHHELYGGGGFPDGLKGEAIPQGSRVIAAADFIDNTLRRHAGADALTLTLEELNGSLGTLFDPTLFARFKKVAAEYYRLALPASGYLEKELEPKSLYPGMVTSRDVRSGSGLLLISKDKKLNKESIKILDHMSAIDPSESGIFVWIDK